MLARELMHPGVECIGEHESLQEAAERMRALDVGCLPICGHDGKLHGMVTDRDIVVWCLAEGRDPTTMMAGELATGAPVWVAADADDEQVIRLMSENRVKRLPVIEDGRLVGMISEVDVARELRDDQVAHVTEAIYAGR